MKYLVDIAQTQDDKSISLVLKLIIGFCATLAILNIYFLMSTTVSGFEVHSKAALQIEEQKKIAELEREYHEKKIVLSTTDAQVRGYEKYTDVRRVSVTKEVYSLAR